MSAAPHTFDLRTTPLQRGTNLLEASAGTGKTYAIAGLFVRLVLEAGLSVEQILAVTYTEAATAELRQRIRKALADTLKAFLGMATSDVFIAHLVTAHAQEKAEMTARLQRALACFDQAAIYTIHGFCQRTLQDRAFESGVLFDVELITDQSAILREIAGDFWRKHFYETQPVTLCFALKNRLSPDELLKFFQQCVNHPFLKFHSRVAGRSLADQQQNLERLFAETRDEWKRNANQIKVLFGSHITWGNNPYNQDDAMSERFKQLEECFACENMDHQALTVLADFHPRAIAAGVAKRAKSPAPSHRFLDLCGELAEAENDFLAGVRLDFVQFAREELPKRKALRKVQSFDDLLMNVYRVLLGPGGTAFTQNLRATYRAALIDEFQDTDPVQYEIFRRLFADGQSYLYLIGDPKQAIYAFRGADIFTYMQAAGAAERRYTLGENWRSESKLVRAVNTVFSRPKDPFVFEQIQFAPVAAKADADKRPLTVEGAKTPPFQIWYCEPEGKSISRTSAEERLPQIVATEIVRLLNGNTRIGERALKPEDIAVLVPENKHARLMQDSLRGVNVPCVLHTTASLFASFEAHELRRVLMAIVQPTNDRLLRGALATELSGSNATQLAELSEAVLQEILERFHHYLALWTEHGFFRMFRHWLQQESVRRRLLAFSDGERRLTNLLHLGETLHQAEGEFRFGASGLLQWLDERMASDADVAEEHQLRLERDDNAVRLITIHKSKGLEYGVVFCPFNWRDSNPPRGSREVFFHDLADASRLACDLGSAEFDTHKEMAGRERLAENVRLLYVAVTRAVHRSYFAWGKFKDAGTSAAAWLLHQPEQADDLNLAELAEQFQELPPGEIRSQLNELADASGGTIGIEELPEAKVERYQPPELAEQKLDCREFTRKIARDWRITSFSLLSSTQTQEAPDYDDVLAPASVAEDAIGIFAFPRGVRAGTCFHEILQEADFSGTSPAPRNLIEEKLRDHGLFETTHVAAVETMFRNLVRTPLIPEHKNFIFSHVAKGERLNELKFYFPIKNVAYHKLYELIKDLAANGIETTQPDGPAVDVVNGFLKGFIDVVFRFDGKFYIADWKSNWLGNRVEDYHQDALRNEMARHHYFLQSHLYTVALHKYLALRLPDYDFDTHFGGVFYVFLRGLDPARPELGIFRDRPALKTIQRLAETLGNP